MTDQFAISASGVSKSFGQKRAVRDVSMQMEAGRIHVLLGPNGSGKTTLAKILAGAITPDEGRVERSFADRQDNGASLNGIGFLFDSSAHWEALTGEENAWFFARSFGIDPKEASRRIGALFHELMLDDVAGDPVSTFSFGMKRKLAIAEALVHRPRLLILDEPSIGLDHASRTRLYSLVQSASHEGQAVLVSTNDMNEAKHLADKVWIMAGGRIVTSGTPANLIRELDRKVTIDVEIGVPISVDPLRNIEGLTNVAFLEEDGRMMIRSLVDADHEGTAMGGIVKILSERGADIHRIDVRRPDLGDVFLKHSQGVS